MRKNADGIWVFAELKFRVALIDVARMFASSVAALRITRRAIADGVWALVYAPFNRVSVFFCRAGVIRMQCTSIRDGTVPTSPHTVARRAAMAKKRKAKKAKKVKARKKK
jgi:hypothetical protein